MIGHIWKTKRNSDLRQNHVETSVELKIKRHTRHDSAQSNEKLNMNHTPLFVSVFGGLHTRNINLSVTIRGLMTNWWNLKTHFF